MSKRSVIIAVFILLGFGVVTAVLFFVFRAPVPLSTKPGILFAPVVRQLPEIPSIEERPVKEERATIPLKVEKVGETPVLAVFFGSTVQLPSLLAEELRPLLEAARRIVEPALQKEESPKTTFSLFAPEIVLTPDEVFRVLYPSFFVSGLNDIQNELVAEGVIAAGDASDFSKEGDIKNFMLIATKYLADRGIIAADEFALIQNSLRAFFDRPYAEKLLEVHGLVGVAAASAVNTTQFVFPTQKEALEEFYRDTKIKEQIPSDALKLLPQVNFVSSRFLSATLLRGLMLFGRFFVVPSTQAAFCGPTFCIRPPLCALEGVGASPGGTNFPTPCCSGRICGVPIGCLELCGNGSRPFIWDPATSICGCSAA